MKPLSRAARIRAWLNAQEALTEQSARLPREIVAGVQAAERDEGLPESTEKQVYWAVAMMFKEGFMARDRVESGAGNTARYWLVCEPVLTLVMTPEEKRARAAENERIRARARRAAAVARPLTEAQVQARARHAARMAARDRKRAERLAATAERKQAEQQDRRKREEAAAKKRAQAEALARAQELVRQMKAKQSAHRQPRKPVAEPLPRRDLPAPKPALLLESSFDAEARGVEVERLPPGVWSKPLKHFPVAKAA